MNLKGLVNVRSLVTYLLLLILFMVIPTQIALGEGVESKTGIIFKTENKEGMYRQEVKGGEHFSFKFYLQNITEERRKITVYPSDILSAVNGGMTYHTDIKKENKFVGSWIKTEAKEYILEPKEVKEIIIEVEVPTELEDGQYIGVVAYSYEEENANEIDSKESDSTNFQFNYNYTMGIQLVFDYNIDKSEVEVEVELGKIEANLSKSGDWVYKIPVDNKGTILDKPTLEAVIKNSSKEEIYTSNFTFGSVYPFTKTYTELVGNKKLPVGDYKLKVKLKSINGKIKEKEIDFKVTQGDVEKQEIEEKLTRGEVVVKEDNKMLYTVIGVALILFIIIIILVFIMIRKNKNEKKDEATKE